MSLRQDFINKNSVGGGYVALMSVLLISAAASIAAVSLLTVGNIFERTVSSSENSYRSESLANLCANKALMVVRLMPSYTGNESVYIDDDRCDILEVTESAGVYTIDTEGHVGESVRKVRVMVLRAEDPDTAEVTMTLQTWNNLADF